MTICPRLIPQNLSGAAEDVFPFFRCHMKQNAQGALFKAQHLLRHAGLVLGIHAVTAPDFLKVWQNSAAWMAGTNPAQTWLITTAPSTTRAQSIDAQPRLLRQGRERLQINLTDRTHARIRDRRVRRLAVEDRGDFRVVNALRFHRA